MDEALEKLDFSRLQDIKTFFFFLGLVYVGFYHKIVAYTMEGSKKRLFRIPSDDDEIEFICCYQDGDASYLIVATKGDSVYIWDLTKSGKRHKLQLKSMSFITCMDINCGVLTIGMYDGMVFFVDIKQILSGKKIQILHKKGGERIVCMVVNNGNTYTLESGGQIICWGRFGQTSLKVKHDLTSKIHSMKTSNGRLFLMLADDQMSILKNDGDKFQPQRGPRLPPRARASCLAVSPDGQYIAVGTEDGQIFVLDLKSGCTREVLVNDFFREEESLTIHIRIRKIEFISNTTLAVSGDTAFMVVTDFKGVFSVSTK